MLVFVGRFGTEVSANVTVVSYRDVDIKERHVSSGI